MPLEIERKYILSSVPVFTPNAVLVIAQYYTHEARYRSAINMSTKEAKFYKTVKIPVSAGVNEEDECEITEREWWKCVRHCQMGLHKVRHIYHWMDGTFEIDVFSHRSDLILMEIELESMDQEFNMPTWISDLVVEEVTGQKWYNNSHLAVAV